MLSGTALFAACKSRPQTILDYTPVLSDQYVWDYVLDAALHQNPLPNVGAKEWSNAS